jgi:hypothetical protein
VGARHHEHDEAQLGIGCVAAAAAGPAEGPLVLGRVRNPERGAVDAVDREAAPAVRVGGGPAQRVAVCSNRAESGASPSRSRACTTALLVTTPRPVAPPEASSACSTQCGSIARAKTSKLSARSQLPTANSA